MVQYHLVWHNAIMNTTVNMDRAGRIVLPKPVRDELLLSPGDALDLELSRDQIVLKLARTGRMRKVKGVWVFDSGGPPVEAGIFKKALHRVRKERERKILGGMR